MTKPAPAVNATATAGGSIIDISSNGVIVEDVNMAGRDTTNPGVAPTVLPALQFEGYSDAGTLLAYAQMAGVAEDVTDGAENGRVDISVRDGGVMTQKINVTGAAITLQDDTTVNGIVTGRAANTTALRAESTTGNLSNLAFVSNTGDQVRLEAVIDGINQGSLIPKGAGASVNLGTSGNPWDNGVFKGAVTAQDFTVDGGFFNIGGATVVTIAAGAVTATRSHHFVDTEGGAASDTLDTINGGTDGDLLLLRTVDSARTVTIAETNNIRVGGTTFTLSDTSDRILLVKAGALWITVSQADNV